MTKTVVSCLFPGNPGIF